MKLTNLFESDFDRRKRERDSHSKVASMRDRMRAGETAVPCSRCETSGEYVWNEWSGESSECAACDGYGYKTKEMLLKKISLKQKSIDRTRENLQNIGGSPGDNLQIPSLAQNLEHYQKSKNTLEKELSELEAMEQ
jgi:hypothetical protein